MRRLLPLAALLCLASCGCHRRVVVVHEAGAPAPAPAQEVVVEGEPPPLRAESRPPAPWVPGHWARRPRGWVWVPGRWS